jgi:high-affinity Fe2+/Pb2+ permease
MTSERSNESEAPSGESDKERVDRELIEFLNELRVVLPGVQVLFAFLLTLPFTSYYPDADGAVRLAYIIAFYSVAIAAVLMMTVSSLHRIRFRKGDKEAVLRSSSRLMLAGMAFLAVGMVAVVWMISEIMFEANQALANIIGGVALVFVVALWFGLPLSRRYRGLGTDE